MKFYKGTVLFIVAGVVAITAYDVWALAGGYERTISFTLGAAAYQWPAIPFVFGFLAGHLFFANKGTSKGPASVSLIRRAP